MAQGLRTAEGRVIEGASGAEMVVGEGGRKGKSEESSARVEALKR